MFNNFNKQNFKTTHIKPSIKMNLVDEDDQTYKLSEENKKISVLTVKLPLNADLRKKPAVVIDDKNLGSLKSNM